MREEHFYALQTIDLLTRQSIEQSCNALHRQEILESAKMIYVAEVKSIGFSNLANRIYFSQNYTQKSSTGTCFSTRVLVS